jgi:hypothetical protein
MVAMMVPSATPMLLVFATISRRRSGQERAFVPLWVFLAGYLVLWTAFSLAATLAQWGLHSLALISPMMVGTSPLLGSLLLIAAGVYQWTPPKRGLFKALPFAGAIPANLLARRFCGRFPYGPASRSLLPRLLLAPDGSSVRGRRDEPSLDRRTQCVRAVGKNHSPRILGGQGCGTFPDGLGWLHGPFGRSLGRGGLFALGKVPDRIEELVKKHLGNIGEAENAFNPINHKIKTYTHRECYLE